MSNKRKILFRYIPSVFIVIFVLALIAWSVFFSNFGNDCVALSQWMVGKGSAEEVTVVMDKFITLLKNKDYNSLEKLVNTKYINQKGLYQLTYAFDPLFPKEKAKKIMMISYHKTYMQNDKNLPVISSALLYKFPKNTWIVEIDYTKQDNVQSVVGFRFSKFLVPPDVENKVSFNHLSEKQIFVLSMCLAIPLFILLMLIICINTDIPKRKWLWMLFILFGIVVVNFNWTTQKFLIQPIGVQLFGAGWHRAGCYAPLIFSFAMPIGAIVFLIRQILVYRKKRH